MNENAIITIKPRPNQCRGLEITEVAVRLADDRAPSDFLGYANIVLNGAFAVRGLRLIRPDSGSGRFVAMADQRRVCSDGIERFLLIAHPIKADVRGWLERTIFDAYDQAVLERAGEEAAA